jgi:hypothetical protein
MGSLYKKTSQPVLLVDPRALDSMEMREVSRVFGLRTGLTKFPITQEKFNPFPSTYLVPTRTPSARRSTPEREGGPRISPHC